MKTAIKSISSKRSGVRVKEVHAVKSGTRITKEDVRAAVVNIFRTDPSILRDVVTEFMEDEGLYRAMKEVENEGEASRAEVFQALREAKKLTA